MVKHTGHWARSRTKVALKTAAMVRCSCLIAFHTPAYPPEMLARHLYVFQALACSSSYPIKYQVMVRRVGFAPWEKASPYLLRLIPISTCQTGKLISASRMHNYKHIKPNQDVRSGGFSWHEPEASFAQSSLLLRGSLPWQLINRRKACSFLAIVCIAPLLNNCLLSVSPIFLSWCRLLVIVFLLSKRNSTAPSKIS